MKKNLVAVQVIVLIIVLSCITGTVFANLGVKEPKIQEMQFKPVLETQNTAIEEQTTLYEANMKLAMENMEQFLAKQESTVSKREEEIAQHLADKEKEKLKKGLEESNEYELVSRGSLVAGKNDKVFTVTAYDLSYESCGKVKGDRYYGVTSSGVSIEGKTREQAMAIATDPKVIPTGSKVQVVFIDEEYSHFSGVYTALDTGGAIKGEIIDLFMGDFDKYESDQSVWDFGRRKAYIKIIETPKGEK